MKFILAPSHRHVGGYRSGWDAPGKMDQSSQYHFQGVTHVRAFHRHPCPRTVPGNRRYLCVWLFHQMEK